MVEAENGELVRQKARAVEEVEGHHGGHEVHPVREALERARPRRERIVGGDRERGAVERGEAEGDEDRDDERVERTRNKDLLAEEVVENTEEDAAEERRERAERPEDDDLVESGAHRSCSEVEKNLSQGVNDEL